MDLIRVPEAISNNSYEAIFCVKYNRKIFRDESLAECLKKSFFEVEKEHGFSGGKETFAISEVAVGPSYVRVIILCTPQYGVHQVVSKLKRASGRALRELDPTLTSRLPSIWTNNVYYRTLGRKASPEEILAYVDSQKG